MMMNSVFYLCAFILSVSCLFYTHKRRVFQKAQSYIYMYILANVGITSLADLIGNHLYSQGIRTDSQLFLRVACMYVYFIFHITLASAYTVYIMHVNGVGIGRSIRFYLLFLSPMIIGEALIFTNPFHHKIFLFDASGTYSRGELTVVLYILATFYVLVSIYFMIRYKKALSKTDYITLWYFFGLSILGLVIQAIYINMQIEGFAESIAMLGIMLTIEAEDKDIDSASAAYNRGAFVSENIRLIHAGHKYAVISLNLTNYRFFSRMLHYDEQGDLLHMMCIWLKKLDKNIFVYRLSDSNFSLIYLYKENDQLEETISKIKARFTDGWIYKNAELDFNLQIRVALVPEEVHDPELLLELADDSGHIEKAGVSIQRGKDLYFLARRVQVEEALRRAITENRFQIFYQPIWLAGTGKIYSAEALLRLKDPELGFLPPDEIIPIAERNGLIGEIGRIVFESVCRFMETKEFKDLKLKYIEVNLSIYQLILSNTKEQFEKSMSDHGIKPDQINLEITESASLSAASTVAASIEELKKAGFHFSLDDYGTGYSNLTNIVNMDFLNIKSDKGLLWASDNDSNSKKLLMDSIRMMRRLGMNVIQEGVETKEQLDLVLDAGANLIQGYYFSKPLAEADFIRFVNKFNSEDHRPS